MTCPGCEGTKTVKEWHIPVMKTARPRTAIEQRFIINATKSARQKDRSTNCYLEKEVSGGSTAPLRQRCSRKVKKTLSFSKSDNHIAAMCSF